MYNTNSKWPYPCFMNAPLYTSQNMYSDKVYQCPYFPSIPIYGLSPYNQFPPQYIPYTEQGKGCVPLNLKDYGPEPFVINIEEAAKQNDNFRTALWTGNHLQLTLMSINVGEDIGLEMHPDVDQFLRIEEGRGIVKMGDSKNNLNFQRKVYEDYIIIIPAGKWHNLINTGDKPIKLYSIYAPPNHPHGTVHPTKKDAGE
ncbi:MAG TPA: cupin domain-containing protein [Acetivibrio sp.]|uniref:cupin domain-containing protein n=1 Tax=Acetivibrio sp. TaxID=1872092 RepID=UPI002C458925|nr:cupin domain-containing protein [Acetivibrio sp.]HOM01574.1 cupin domain-containing protein [Acetivibrio sp.]